MRFIIDECTGPRFAAWLAGQGHAVLSVYDEIRGISDEEVLRLATEQDRIVVTNDKDFGELVFREHRSHRGVILLRLENETFAAKTDAMRRLLELFATGLEGQFVVVTEAGIRFSHS